ncbi:MAG: BLUF domain-containing protein [Pseudomonadota bacterium]
MSSRNPQIPTRRHRGVGFQKNPGPHSTRSHTTSSAPLAALVYKSRATQSFDAGSLDELISRAQARNADEDLTGAVYYDSGRFLQWLEGPADRLDHVAASISRDQRHTDIKVLSYGFVPERMYSGWTMRLLTRNPARTVARALSRFESDMTPSIAARELAAGDETATRAFLARAPATAAGTIAQCEKIAAAYLQLWQAELCNGADITIGLSHLLRVFRRRKTSFIPAGRTLTSRFLVASAPGEPHFIGADFAAEFLLEKGYLVDYLLPLTDQDIVERIADTSPDAVVIATSPVFSRTERADELARLAGKMCNAPAEASPSVTLYGRAPATLRCTSIGRVTACAADIDLARGMLAGTEPPTAAGRHLLH